MPKVMMSTSKRYRGEQSKRSYSRRTLARRELPAGRLAHSRRFHPLHLAP
jgi:hypothetical protein